MCLHKTQEAWLFLWQCIWWPMQQGGSHQNQERTHWWQWLQIKCQCWISSSGPWGWHHSHWRWWSESLLPILGMLSMTNMTLLTNTAMPAVGAVFNMSRWVWAHQSPQSSQGLHQLWWCGGCGGLWGYGRSRWRLCHGCEQGQCWPGWWWLALRNWLMGEHHQLWSQVSNWRQLFHVLIHQRCSSKVCL